MSLDTTFKGRFLGRSRAAPRSRPPLEVAEIIESVDSITRTPTREPPKVFGAVEAPQIENFDLTFLPQRRPPKRTAFRTSRTSSTLVAKTSSTPAPRPTPKVKLPRHRRPVRRLIRPTIVGIVLCAAGIAWLFDIGSLVVRSDSMAGSYPAGSVTLTREVSRSAVRVGDVILVQRVGRVPVLHRIIDLDDSSASPSVRTKGDANPKGDPEPFLLPARVRVAFIALPGFGYFLSAILTPLGWMFMMVLPATLLTAAALRGIWVAEVARPTSRAIRLRRARKIRRACAAVLVVTTMAFGIVKFGGWTLSVFSDTPNVDANDFTTGIW